MRVPLFLLKASKEISVILRESTNTDIPTLEYVDDLETILEQSKFLLKFKCSMFFFVLLGCNSDEAL